MLTSRQFLKCYANKKTSLAGGFFDFLFILVIIFLLLGSFTSPMGMGVGMGMGNNCEITCITDGGCPFLSNQCSSNNCVFMKPKVEETPEEISAKEHNKKIKTLIEQNQILAYELEQAKMKYSICKLLSETEQLKTVETQDASINVEMSS